MYLDKATPFLVLYFGYYRLTISEFVEKKISKVLMSIILSLHFYKTFYSTTFSLALLVD